MKVPKAKKLPSGSWHIMLRLGDEIIYVTENTETECIKKAELIKAEHRNGKRDKRLNMTIGDAIDKYIREKEKVLSPATINGYKRVRNNRFKSYINKKPSDIKSWQAVINDEIADGQSAKSVKNSWSLLESSLKYCGMRTAPEVTLPKIVPADKKWLEPDQVKIFVKAVHGHPCEIPALLGLHGLRRSEILGLDWDKIDLKSKTIRIEGAAVIGSEGKLVQKKLTKTKASRRTVPIMIPELQSALEAVPKEKRKGLIYDKTPTLIWEQVNRICEKNDLPQIGVHGLRHSFASLAFSADVGMTEREVMEIGGWDDYQTVHKIYEHLSSQNRLKAENKFAAFFKKEDKKEDNQKKTQ